MTMTPDSLRTTVRDRYAAVARGDALSCCGDADGAEEINMIGDAYDDVEGYVAEADLKLGCGLPVEHAGLEPGQTVLDLGAGAGLDAFVARRVVGETGQVLGVDFTPEMVEKARENARKLGYANVRFELGDIESLPFADASVDVVISNCVLNLVPDKARAFTEMARVLRPGGHFSVSDVVSRGTLPASVRQSAELYAGCVAGALDQADYLRLLSEAGFENVEIVAERPIDLPEGLLPEGAVAPLHSVTVRGVRPGGAARTLNPDTASPSMPERLPERLPEHMPEHLPEHMPERLPALQIYEPAMCCSTGLCGPDPDEALVQFSADIKSLSADGVIVQRFNLSQSPDAFVKERSVHQAIIGEGMDVLPMVVREGNVVSKGRYPSRSELARMADPGRARGMLEIMPEIMPGMVPGTVSVMAPGTVSEQGGSCCGGEDTSCC